MDNVARKKSSLELKKHINAIHCSNNLTLVQRKLFNALLFNAYPELPYKLKFEIRGKDLCALIGYNSNDTGKLKSALLGLITIAIEWSVVDCSTGQEKKWKASSILASAELSGGMCVYEYSQVMKEFLYQPEIYGKIDIGLMSKFKSSYGLALYENCIRYQSLPQTPWFPIEIFRKLMGVFDNRYLAFKDFKKRVLDIAVNEVNTLAQINVLPVIERSNQKVVKIQFKLEKKSVSKDTVITNSALSNGLDEILIKTFGLSPPMINELTAKYDAEYIKDKIEVVLHSESFQAGKIRGLAGYLLEALRKDYKANKSSRKLVDENRRLKEMEINATKQAEEGRVKRYAIYRAKKITSFLDKLEEKQYQNIVLAFEAYLQQQNVVAYGWYKKYGLEHPATKGCFNIYIYETQKNQLGHVLSFEEFCDLLEA